MTSSWCHYVSLVVCGYWTDQELGFLDEDVMATTILNSVGHFMAQNVYNGCKNSAYQISKLKPTITSCMYTYKRAD